MQRVSSKSPKATAGLLYFFALALVLLTILPHTPFAEAKPKPDAHSTDDNLPVAATFFWFNNLEVGICYDVTGRLTSVDDWLSCNMQENYDLVNNTYQLPQTCIALKPKDEPLLGRMKLACTTAGGKFDLMQPNSPEAQAAAQAAEPAQGGGIASTIGKMFGMGG